MHPKKPREAKWGASERADGGEAGSEENDQAACDEAGKGRIKETSGGRCEKPCKKNQEKSGPGREPAKEQGKKAG